MSVVSASISLPPRYEAIASLGRGGGGEVWSVRDRITGRVVALKALGEDAAESEVMALVREAVALSGVEGLGVPRVLRFGRLPGSGRSYMVRELVEGRSLAERIGEDGDPLVSLRAIARAADQLTRLHRALLLHGDIKPANIIVGDDGRATLVDLGLAATWLEGGSRPTGLTPRYAAPELLEGGALTVRAEVFALGATLEEALEKGRKKVAPQTIEALRQVVARATAKDPNERYPSADELASALRRAANLPPPGDQGGAAWPIVGLDAPSAELLAQIAALPDGGGVVVTGPRYAGRSALLRRIAWSLGVEGRAVAWIEAAHVEDTRDAIEIELSALDDGPGGVVLVDDADRLDAAALARLDEVRRAGAKVVYVASMKAASFPGQTFEVFPMQPLESADAFELVRRAIPSLSDAVIAHVVALAEGWPGRIRAVLVRLERAPVVAPADVDRLLEDDPIPVTSRGGEPAEIHRLLDRGHFDDAAERLDRYAGEATPSIAIARARLATNRGEAARALRELSGVESQVRAQGDPLLSATWHLHAARAHLRAGHYAEAEQRAEAACNDLPLLAVTGAQSKARRTLVSGVPEEAPAPMPISQAQAQLIAADALAVSGLAQSYASRHDEARATLEHAVSLARDLDQPRILSVALGSLAFALQRADRLNEAVTAYEEAFVAAEKAGDAGSVATIRLNLASIAKQRGDLATAIAHFEAAVDMGRRSGRTATLRQALLNLANLDLYLGRLARARSSIDALAAQRADLPPHQRAELLALEAEHAARTGDLPAADRLCAECAEAYESMGRHGDAAEARLERVLFAATSPSADPAELSREIDKAEAALGGGTAHRALLALARGRMLSLKRDEVGARASYDEALSTAQSSGQRDLIWRALDARGALELAAGQTLRAKRDRENALGILEEIAERLPRDLREVYWNDARRRAMRASFMLDLASGPTVTFSQPSQERLARVLEINREIAGEHDLARLLGRVTDHAIALLRAERGFVILKAAHGADSAPHKSQSPAQSSGSHGTQSAPVTTVDDDLAIYASRDESGDDPHARFSRSIADRVIGSGEPVVTASARDDTRMADYLSVHQLMLQSVACVPIRARTGEVIGALYLETRLRPASSFADEMPTLVAFADQVAIAIETARLLGENEQRERALAQANKELEAARLKLEELLGHRTAQLAATRRDLRSARAVLRSHFGYEGLVGTSEAMRRLYALIDRIKDNDVPVLLTGESGTGKEIIARALHNAGPRAKKAFVGINCGAIPEHLLESELFGHMRGAFTGADRDRKGLFREATEGTILLDEIGEMPHKMQAGLLRVLQEKVVRPVGGTREERVDTRIIAATHRDLSQMVADGTFREDLYYRLHVITVAVPPLRDRLDDIPVLIDHFLGIFAARYGRERRSVSRAALKRLMAYAWPGNVRQLENVLLNAWVLSDDPELEPRDFELPDAPARRGDKPAPAPLVQASPGHTSTYDPGPIETSLDAHRAKERERILVALGSCNWNRVRAAQIVGMPRRTFYRRLKEYGIQ